MSKYEQMQNEIDKLFDIDEQCGLDFLTANEIVTRSLQSNIVLDEKGFFSIIDKELAFMESSFSFIKAKVNLIKELKKDLLDLCNKGVEFNDVDNLKNLVDVGLRSTQACYNVMEHSLNSFKEKFSKENRESCKTLEEQIGAYGEALTIYSEFGLAQTNYALTQETLFDIENLLIEEIEQAENTLGKNPEE